ncbi:MAG: hypothetical protein OXG04_26930 [Acidobacteria bacterium]|nr:hypothetical protein [Acidobacteriota bacterium]
MASERGPDARRKRRAKPASRERVEQAEAATAARIEELKRRPTSQPHGTRARYMRGCRCVPCRAANSRYECRRQLERLKGRANGCTTTEQVRKHLLRLSRQGIGYKQVAKAARLSPGALQQVRLGLRKHMRAQSVARVLAIGAEARAPGALVPAGSTLRRIEWLLKEGFTRAALARMLGSKAKQPNCRSAEIGSRRARPRKSRRSGNATSRDGASRPRRRTAPSGEKNEQGPDRLMNRDRHCGSRTRRLRAGYAGRGERPGVRDWQHRPPG